MTNKPRVYISGIVVAILLSMSGFMKAQAQPWEVYQGQGLWYYGHGDYGQAETNLRQAWAEAQNNGHTSDALGADLIHQLAQAMIANKDYTGAQALLQQEETIRRNDKQSPRQLAFCLLTIADCDYELGNFSTAQGKYLESIGIMDKLPQSFEIAAAMQRAHERLSVCASKVGIY